MQCLACIEECCEIESCFAFSSVSTLSAYVVFSSENCIPAEIKHRSGLSFGRYSRQRVAVHVAQAVLVIINTPVP